MEWLLTYAVHSTALIASVWLLTSVIPKISLGTQETLWKVALLGPLLTATVHQIGGVPSVGGELSMPSALRSDPATAAAPREAATPATAPGVVERRIIRHRAGELEITAVREREAAVAPAVVAAAAAPLRPSPWRWVLLSLWGAGAALALGRLVWARSRLRKQLRGRRDVIEDPVLEAFLELCSKAGLPRRPRLTASAHLRSPIALGRREICVPERAVDSLTPPQQQSMLAHEMAHLVRRDPHWMVLTAVVEGVFFFQPLNHLARRKIQEVAEFQCDDWAARHSGTGVHLAKCLAEVAGWVEDGPPLAPTVASMADRSSPIMRRITRLLHQQRRGGKAHPVGRVALTVGTLALMIALVPGVSPAQAPKAPGATMRAQAVPSSGARTVTIEDRSDGGHDRSLVRVLADGEIVEIEVQSPRAVVPEPPPPADDRIEIMIHGHFGHFGHFGHPPWGGGVDVLGLGLDLDGLELWIDDDEVVRRSAEAYFHAERARARAERARERARRDQARWERHVERIVERAERAERRAERIEDAVEDAEVPVVVPWSGIFGVSRTEPEPREPASDRVFAL